MHSNAPLASSLSENCVKIEILLIEKNIQATSDSHIDALLASLLSETVKFVISLSKHLVGKRGATALSQRAVKMLHTLRAGSVCLTLSQKRFKPLSASMSGEDESSTVISRITVLRIMSQTRYPNTCFVWITEQGPVL